MQRHAGPSFQDVTNLFQNGGVVDRDRAMETLREFVDRNEDLAKSANFKSTKIDKMGRISEALADERVKGDEHMVLLLLKVLKITSRKHDNRMQIGDEDMRAVLHYQQEPINCEIAAEAANVLLNLCYEGHNVERIIRCGGIPSLVEALSKEDRHVQANAAGAIQSICFQDAGRKSVRCTAAIGRIVGLLDSDHVKVRLRSVGALHNISSERQAIQAVRKTGAIPKVVALLRSPHMTIKASAAGVLQNLSREVASRIEIRALDSVIPLADLLSASDLQAQVCAAGALLNLVGAEVESKCPEHRTSMTKMVSLILAGSMICDAVGDEPAHIV